MDDAGDTSNPLDASTQREGAVRLNASARSRVRIRPTGTSTSSSSRSGERSVNGGATTIVRQVRYGGSGATFLHPMYVRVRVLWTPNSDVACDFLTLQTWGHFIFVIRSLS